MLADKFHSYKLILIIVVASVAIFHTSLLHIDARTSSNVKSSGTDFETPAEIFCSRLGAVLRFENQTCDDDDNREMWTFDWIPSQCRPMDCGVPTRMQLCLSDGNCTQIAIGSTSVLEMDAILDALPSDGGNCTAQIVSVQTDQTPIAASLLCNCPVRCPAIAAISETSNATSDGISEMDRINHNKGFWLYFILRHLFYRSL